MNRYLLDVNAFLALLDPLHIHHHSFHRWFGRKLEATLVLCSHVENGVIRVASQPGYSNCMGTSGRVRAMLIELTRDVPTDRCTREISLCDESVLRTPESLSPSRVSDLYLLALAHENRAKFATFDQRIPAHAVVGGDETLELIPVIED